MNPRRDLRPSRGHCAARNSRAQGAARVLDCAPPALRAADGLDRASRDPCPGNYRRPQRKCLTTVGSGVTVGSSSTAVVSQPPPHRPMWSTSGSAVSNHGSFPFSNHFLVVPSCDVTSANLATESDCASVSGQAQIRSCTTRPIHHAATALRLSEVDASGDALSAPITVNNSGIDARTGQAYHGQETTTTNGTRPAVARSRAGKGSRARRNRRRCFAPCVRSSAGAPGRT